MPCHDPHARPRPLGGLTRRSQFLAVQRHGDRAAMPGLVLQALLRPSGRGDGPGFSPPLDATAGPGGPGDPAEIRFGLTASRKVGGAVQRNRARRRLRALAREVLPAQGRPGTDYVLIARAATPDLPFAELRRDLERALARVARSGPADRRRGRRQGGAGRSDTGGEPVPADRNAAGRPSPRTPGRRG